MARYNIVGGPSRVTLEETFFKGNSEHRRKVTFQLENSGGGLLYALLPIVLNEVSWEDGSGDRWLFKGYYPGSVQGSPAQGFYSTNTRTGWVEVEY